MMQCNAVQKAVLCSLSLHVSTAQDYCDKHVGLELKKLQAFLGPDGCNDGSPKS